MYPHERSLVKSYANRPFAIVGVNSDPDPDIVVKLKRAGTVTWDSFFDGGLIGGPIASQWGVRGWPTIYLLDATGKIRAKNLRGKQLDAEIEKLVKEAEAPAAEQPETPAPPGPPVR